MKGRSRGVVFKRTNIAATSILLLVAICIATTTTTTAAIAIAIGVPAAPTSYTGAAVGATTMLKSGLCFFWSKTTLTTTKTSRKLLSSLSTTKTKLLQIQHQHQHQHQRQRLPQRLLQQRSSFPFLQKAIAEEYFSPDKDTGSRSSSRTLWNNYNHNYSGNRCNIRYNTAAATTTSRRFVSSFFPSPIATLPSKAPPDTTTTSTMPKRKAKFYAVAKGRNPGVYSTWDECQSQVKGFSNAKFKSFGTNEEAESFVGINSSSNSNNNNNNKSAATASSTVESTFSAAAASIKKRKLVNANENNAAAVRPIGSGSKNTTNSNDNSTDDSLPSSSEYVPLGSFTRYVERNMERDRVQSDPRLKQHVETEIDRFLSDADAATMRSTNWNLLPLVALPGDNDNDINKNNDEPIKEPAATATATATASSGSGVATRSNKYDGNNDDEIIPPHKLFFHVMFDGGSRGNPHGHAGAGTYIVTQKFYHSDNDDDTTTKRGKATKPKTNVAQDKANVRTYLGLGKLTNNQAEYQGLVTGLEQILKAVKKFTASSSFCQELESVTVFIQGDSDLIVKQMKGLYACKSPKLKFYHRRALDLVKATKEECKKHRLGFDITFEHVYRADNKIADALANEAMDAQRSWTTTTMSTPPRKKKDATNKNGDDNDGDDDSAIEV